MSRCPKAWQDEFTHITTHFPVRLKEMMGGMTLCELSSLSGVSLGTLTSWTKGRTLPDLALLFSVAQCLDASVDWLIALDAPGAPNRTEYDTQPVED